MTSFPEDHTMNCDEELDNTMPTATDACGQTVEITFVDEAFSQVRRIRDMGSTFLPSISAATCWSPFIHRRRRHQLQVSPRPADVSVECDGAWPTDMAEATDACSDVSIMVSETVVLV